MVVFQEMVHISSMAGAWEVGKGSTAKTNPNLAEELQSLAWQVL
jgi:hypothetical protein